MVEKIERDYIVPLRKHWRKAPKYKRSKRAVSALRKFLERHMKSDNVKIGKELNEKILSRGFRHPPPKVEISVIKEENVVKANLKGIPFKEEAKEEKKESLVEKVKGKVVKKPEEEIKEIIKKSEPEKEERILKESSDRISQQKEKVKEEYKEKIRKDKIITKSKKEAQRLH